MKVIDLIRKDLVRREPPSDELLSEEELCMLEDGLINSRMEEAKKNVTIKEFLKNPGSTFYAHPEYTLVISLPVALIVFLLGLRMTWGTPLIDDVMIFTVLIIVTPPAIAFHKKFTNIDKVEEYLPTFLRDLSELSRAGLTLSKAVGTVSRGEYGALTKEVQQMDRSMSWGISFEQTLKNFSKRVPTPVIVRSVSLINQASRAGGRVSSVLEAAARDAREVKLLERERRGNMMVYVVISYMSFFVFIFVIAMLTSTFVPTMAEAAKAAQGSGAGSSFIRGFDPAQYTRLMMHAAVIQGFMSGLVAGQMGEGAVTQGLKHSVIMTMIAWTIFTFLI
ncbi:type II secretion system F family protein [Methanolobus chelungpuianus]|uniref:Secretion system protein n=1 Tax=Methanolobus chelungpuianus TaxID=502115 RepID=A0AAE3HAK8_9EURY|nr:type II secretion system F family protein [Methanolobus chelungpuianus]MCQ6962248.1 secretion system protein [Methanolobus chelungpuianus]